MTLSDEIAAELDTWSPFANALPEEDRARFALMIRRCYEYSPAVCAKDSAFPDEALIMCLLLAQHNAIVWLTGLKSRIGNDARLDI